MIKSQQLRSLSKSRDAEKQVQEDHIFKREMEMIKEHRRAINRNREKKKLGNENW